MCLCESTSRAQPHDDAQRFAPGRLLIGFDRVDAAAAQVAASLVSLATSDEQLYRFKTMPWMAIVDVPVGTERQFFELLSLADGINWVSVDGYGGLTQNGTSCEDPNIYPSNDPYLEDQWWVERIRLDEVWAAGDLGLPDVVLAVIDTGVNYRHPDLAANMWVNDDPPGDVPGVGNGADDDDNGIVDDTHGAAFVSVGADGNPCNLGQCALLGVPYCETCDPGVDDPFDAPTYSYHAYGTTPLDCTSPSPPSQVGGWHGTAIASIISAIGNNNIAVRGFSCDVRLMPVRMFHWRG
jgi:hypothetical protein